MKIEVLIRSSLIPKNFFAIWRSYFGFRLKHFSMVGNTAFYAFRERIQQEVFRNIFCFLAVTGLWVKLFRNSAEFFQNVVNSAICVPRGRFGGKIFFSKKPRQFSFGNWALNFVVFLPKFSRNDRQKSLVPFQTNNFNQVIFSAKLPLSLSCLDFERETSDRVVIKWSTLTE